MDISTDLVDKFGKPVHIGDIVQHRLGLNSKHGGPILYRVAKVGKHVRFIRTSNTDENALGFRPDKNTMRFCVIVDHLHDPVA